MNEGQVTQGVFPGILRRLYLSRQTGMLHMAKGRETCSVCFIEGRIAWGQSSIEECRLGPVLVRHGLLSQEALEQVEDLVGGGKRLGDLLLELGSLDRETLDEALGLQVRETLLAVFAWQEGTWRFEPHAPEHFKGYDQRLPISTGDLILDAVWSVVDQDVIRYALGDLERPLALTTDPMLRYQRLTLTPTDGFLLSQVDGVRPAREALALMPVGADEAQRCLLGLLCTGMVELVEPRREPELTPLTREEVLRIHGRLAKLDHFEVLGLESGASAQDAAAAAARLLERYRPDSQKDPELAALRAELLAIIDRVGEAAAVLSHPRRRDAYENALAVARLGPAPPEPALPEPPAAPPATEVDFQQAEHVLIQAEAELAEGRYWDALQAVEAVFAGLQGRQRVRALMLKGRVYAKNPKWLREAEEQFKQVLAAQPSNAEAYFLLGGVYKAAGVAVRAMAMFRRALEFKPRHAGALAELGHAR
jgi:tetratricopeptide (TPR) repeat protein